MTKARDHMLETGLASSSQAKIWRNDEASMGCYFEKPQPLLACNNKNIRLRLSIKFGRYQTLGAESPQCKISISECFGFLAMLCLPGGTGSIWSPFTSHLWILWQPMIHRAKNCLHLLQAFSVSLPDEEPHIQDVDKIEDREHQESPPPDLLDRVWCELAHDKIEKPLRAGSCRGG